MEITFTAIDPPPGDLIFTTASGEEIMRITSEGVINVGDGEEGQFVSGLPKVFSSGWMGAGYVILNSFGNWWDRVFYPTRSAAEKAIREANFSPSDFTISKAKQRTVWKPKHMRRMDAEDYDESPAAVERRAQEAPK